MDRLEWKRIIGYPCYEVSNNGIVRSKTYDGWRILKQTKDQDGYFKIMLTGIDKKETFFVHRLVATMFLIKKNGDECVNHMDGNKINNNICNLEWTTTAGNNRHAREMGLNYISQETREKAWINHIAKSSKKVQQLKGETVIKTFESISSAARTLKINRGNISQCINGNRNHVNGYQWRLVNE